MTDHPTAATISTSQTIDLLDGPFSGLADGIANDRYALWLGSGISFGRVDGLHKVVPRVLEFLRVQINHGDPACRFGRAVDQVLTLASATPAERASSNLAMAASSWPDIEALTTRLVSKYSELLDITVEGEADDYLMWQGIDIIQTYANPATEPDVAHLCVALLVMEGVVSQIATANWDGLLEAAAESLGGAVATFSVCVTGPNTREPEQRAWLYKFHGCAVLAGRDEATYRGYLVGRLSQINGWVQRRQNKAVVAKLVSMITSRPTLMLGMSAQDANIQAIFAAAENDLAWQWPGDQPGLVFSDDSLSGTQRSMLQQVYQEQITANNREQIQSSSLIRSYADPLLLALYLHVIGSKLKELVTHAPGAIAIADRAMLHKGIDELRNRLATSAEAGRLDFLKAFVKQLSRALGLFRSGDATAHHRNYTPLTSVPVHRIAADHHTPDSGLLELAVVLGVIGVGAAEKAWTVLPIDADALDAGTLKISVDGNQASIVLSLNSYTTLVLEQTGGMPEAAVVIHSKAVIPPRQRSPRGNSLRTGESGRRQVSMLELLQEAVSVKDLLQQFRESVAL